MSQKSNYQLLVWKSGVSTAAASLCVPSVVLPAVEVLAHPVMQALWETQHNRVSLDAIASPMYFVLPFTCSGTAAVWGMYPVYPGMPVSHL